MDDDIDKDGTKRYVFFMMNKFRVYLLKSSGVKDGENKWSCCISLFKRKNHNSRIRTPEFVCYRSTEKLCQQLLQGYEQKPCVKSLTKYGWQFGIGTECKEAPELVVKCKVEELLDMFFATYNATNH